MDKQLLEQEALGFAIKIQTRPGTAARLNAIECYIAGATSSPTVKAKEERIKALEDGIKWALDNPQSVFVFNELAKLLNK